MSYYGARWYDAKLGRFLSADTIVPGPGNAQAFNRYAWAKYIQWVRRMPNFFHRKCIWRGRRQFCTQKNAPGALDAFSISKKMHLARPLPNFICKKRIGCAECPFWLELYVTYLRCKRGGAYYPRIDLIRQERE